MCSTNPRIWKRLHRRHLQQANLSATLKPLGLFREKVNFHHTPPFSTAHPALLTGEITTLKKKKKKVTPQKNPTAVNCHHCGLWSIIYFRDEDASCQNLRERCTHTCFSADQFGTARKPGQRRPGPKCSVGFSLIIQKCISETSCSAQFPAQGSFQPNWNVLHPLAPPTPRKHIPNQPVFIYPRMKRTSLALFPLMSLLLVAF